jgi:hypothetical protein
MVSANVSDASRPASHSRRIQRGTQGSYQGRDRLLQSSTPGPSSSIRLFDMFRIFLIWCRPHGASPIAYWSPLPHRKKPSRICLELLGRGFNRCVSIGRLNDAQPLPLCGNLVDAPRRQRHWLELARRKTLGHGVSIEQRSEPCHPSSVASYIHCKVIRSDAGPLFRPALRKSLAWDQR